MSERYYIWKGELYPSVTSILGVIAKPALVNWAALRVAEAAVAQADVIASLAKIDKEAAIQKLKSAPYREKSAAAQTGSAIHKIAQTISQGGRIDVDKNAAPFVRSFLAFVRDKRPDIVRSELTVYNRTHGYAGTLDALAIMDGVYVLIDFKTGKKIWPEHHLQLAAYANGEFYTDGDIEVSLPTISHGYILHLEQNSYNLVRVDVTAALFNVFLAALEIYRWMQQTGDGWQD